MAAGGELSLFLPGFSRVLFGIFTVLRSLVDRLAFAYLARLGRPAAPVVI